MSHPCGAQFGVPHGVANAINLPHVIRFNAEGGSDIADRYRDIAEVFDVESGGSDAEVGDALAAHVEGMVERMGLPTRLSQVGVPEEGIPALVEGAMGDGLTLLNPREPDEAGLRGAVQAGALSAAATRGEANGRRTHPGSQGVPQLRRRGVGGGQLGRDVRGLQPVLGRHRGHRARRAAARTRTARSPRRASPSTPGSGPTWTRTSGCGSCARWSTSSPSTRTSWPSSSHCSRA